jgi:hypothetical protein
MSEINIQLVREYLELNRFSVLTHWPHQDERQRASEAGSLLFAERLGSESIEAAPFLLRGSDIRLLERIVVEVRAWHADKFYPSVIESSSILAHVASGEVADLARDVFGPLPFVTILVISELPGSAAPRARSLQLLESTGMAHVLEFPTLLSTLAWQLSSQGNYAPSQTLQTLRLLKRYNLLRRQQLEFSFPAEPVPREFAPPVETDLPARQEDVAVEPEGE